MRFLSTLFLAFALIAGGLVAPVLAGDDDPLFINLTTDDPHRANMGITFGMRQFERGHPLTIFLNDKGVFIGAKTNAGTFVEHQEKLAALIEKGALVLICPMCMKHYGVAEADLISGAQIGNPELTGGALFKDDTRTLTW
ncbi:DsrE family protein [Thiocapsa bogorovii]|uniref:DsrE family protein n=1 Tax=Thiocapsa bogorovii TaxID=521689 RepID=UPI001E336982|nr:DsrE family protein [Thiocapsa bogorovii]UHD14863.1 DsrE family protein [Thiocapsa bogorovii]